MWSVTHPGLAPADGHTERARRAPPYLVAVRIQRPIAASAARALTSVRPRRSFPPNSLHPIRLLQSSLIRTIVEMLQQSVVGILILAAAVAAQAPPGRCPEDYGVQTYPHEAACDRFYKVSGRGYKMLGKRKACKKFDTLVNRNINVWWGKPWSLELPEGGLKISLPCSGRFTHLNLPMA